MLQDLLAALSAVTGLLRVLLGPVWRHGARLVLCVIAGRHKPATIEETEHGALHTYQDVNGRTFISEHICARCGVTFGRRLRRNSPLRWGVRKDA